MSLKRSFLWFLRLGKLVSRKVYVVLRRIEEKLNAEFDKQGHDYLVKRTAATYDMVSSPDEFHYARQYTDFIVAELNARGMSQIPMLVDLACGQGRIIKSLLAEPGLDFAEVMAVDFSGSTLDSARRYLGEFDGKVQLRFEESDLVDFLKRQSDRSIDVLLILEVLYMLPQHSEALKILATKLKPGGVAFLSMRSDYYYGLSILRQGMFDSAAMLTNTARGDIFGTGVELNWSRSEQIFEQFPKDYGLQVGKMFGIGTCSGIKNDPHDFIARPSNLSVEELNALRVLEQHMGQRYPDCGRYIVFSVSVIK